MKMKIFSLLGLLFITLATNSCKKNAAASPCDISGGIVQLNSYRFWTALPMYNTTVQVRDENGGLIPTNGAYSAVTEIYYIKPTANWEPSPCTYDPDKEAVFSLAPNRHYTYKATNGAQSWTGAINVPCEQLKCFNIEIK